ncbi:hypothetical protein ACFRI7_32010 [Streptomyces sp. NPDC056716]|uniref:hypothetical protein n=1 Tax=unclassified Streptomyces TaxID=2593676 RepID=UPI00368310DD
MSLAENARWRLPGHQVFRIARPGTLLRSPNTLTGPAHRTTAGIYRASAAYSAHSPTARRDVLAIDAARYQQPHVAARLARTRPWTPRWATGILVNPTFRTILTGHTDRLVRPPSTAGGPATTPTSRTRPGC